MTASFLLLLQQLIQTPVFADNFVIKNADIGLSQQERPIKIERFGTGSESIVILASIHGTEVVGTSLCNQLVDALEVHPEWLEQRTVYLMRLTNPDGAVQGMRGNSQNIDINRNFPTSNFGRGWFNGKDPLSAPETMILMDFFMTVQPSRVLTIHQPLNGIDYDGPAKELAQELSDVSNIRIHRLGSRSGSLGSFVGKEFGTPIITLEIPGYANERSSDWLWVQYGALLHAFIVYEPTN
jgi:protein MpaA